MRLTRRIYSPAQFAGSCRLHGGIIGKRWDGEGRECGGRAVPSLPADAATTANGLHRRSAARLLCFLEALLARDAGLYRGRRQQPRFRDVAAAFDADADAAGFQAAE